MHSVRRLLERLRSDQLPGSDERLQSGLENHLLQHPSGQGREKASGGASRAVPALLAGPVRGNLPVRRQLLRRKRPGAQRSQALHRLQLLHRLVPVRCALVASDHRFAEQVHGRGVPRAHRRRPGAGLRGRVHARLFGDVNDPQSDISLKISVAKTQKLLESHGTKPNFFVVVQK